MYQYEVLYKALVAQGIEQRIPVPCAGVRILSSAIYHEEGPACGRRPYDGRPIRNGQPWGIPYDCRPKSSGLAHKGED